MNTTPRMAPLSTGEGNLIQMNWDPISRIVGSLGVFTKIDFATGKWRSARLRLRFFAAIACS
jgi:hypothetical protein